MASRLKRKHGMARRFLPHAPAIFRQPRTLDPIFPAVPIRLRYQLRLQTEIDAMCKAVEHALTGAWIPEIAQLVVYAADASPASRMGSLLGRIGRQWTARFDKLAPEMADWFATEVEDRVDSVLAAQLRAAGVSVRFRPSTASRNAFDAVRAENVGLIRSIPRQYLTQVETLVMQSVQRGRDLHSLAQGLQKQHGVTRRRAALIALDQNNKATSAMANARYLELGITHAIWQHTAAKEPRPYHVAFSGKKYDIRKGVVLDPKEGVVWPGTAIRCHCVGRPIIPGFDD